MPEAAPSNGPRMPVGLMVAGSEMVSFTILGLILDYALDTMPGFTIGLTLLGLVAAFFQLTRMAKALAAKDAKKTGPSDAPAGPTGGGS